MDYITPMAPAYAEVFMLAMACGILVLDLFLGDERRRVTYALTLLTLAGAFCITVWTHPVERYTFSGMFVADGLAGVVKLGIYVAVAMTLVYSQAYIRARDLYRGEFFVLVLFATLGMMVMTSANHLLTLYLGLELQSLAVYGLVALQRDSSRATEAAMKYFVLGALASGMLLYGMSMLYGATGSLEITRIAEVIDSKVGADVILVFGLVFIVAGLGFKLGAVPFHMWIPDVYEGAPTAVTMFIGAAPKIAALAFIIRVLEIGLGTDFLFAQWQWMLAIMAVLSFVIGNVTAIAQTNIKRMLAYSTISHMGFLLLGVLSGSQDGLASSLFYALIYALMNLGAFGMIMLLSRAGFEADRLEDFKGLNRRSPWCAAVMLLLMFSMAGIPPTVGFYAKLSVLWAVADAGKLWLAVIAVMFSLVGAFYYLRIVRLMYFDAPVDAAPVVAAPGARWLMAANGLAMLVFGLWLFPEWLMELCRGAMQVSLQ